MSSVTTDQRLGVNADLAVKVPCACASTSNLTLSGEQTIDGVTTASSRVLVAGQTDATENGIYKSDSGDWVREPDWDGANDAIPGTMVRVVNGTSNYGYWAITAPSTGSITIGATSVTFSKVDADGVLRADLANTTDQTKGTRLVFLARTNSEIIKGVTPTNYYYPEGDGRRYGVTFDGVTDDTTAVQNTINVAQNANIKADLSFGPMLISSTITVTGAYHWIDMGAVRDIDINVDAGLKWGGGNNDVMLQITEPFFCTFESLICNNRPNAKTGITGIRITATTGTPPQAMSRNVFKSITLSSMNVGIQIGDYTVDGYDSNLDDSQFKFVHMNDVANSIIVDSIDQDNIYIEEFHSGGSNATAYGTRDHVILLKRCGNGFYIAKAFAVTYNITTDNACVDIQDGSFSCDYFSLEGPGTALALKINNSADRGQCNIRNFIVDQVYDSSDRTMSLGGYSGVTIHGCSVPRNIEAVRAVTAINTVFYDGYGFTKIGNGRVQEIGTHTRATANSELTTNSEAGDLILTNLRSAKIRTGLYSGDLVHYKQLVDSTVTGIFDAALADGNVLNFQIFYSVYYTHNLTKNLSHCGAFHISAHSDTDGNIVSAVSSAIGQVNALGAEYASLAVTCTVTNDATNNKITVNFQQINDLADNLKFTFFIKSHGSQQGNNYTPIDNLTLL